MIYNLQDRYKQLIAILWRRLIKSSSLGVKSHLNQFDINYCFPIAFWPPNIDWIPVLSRLSMLLVAIVPPWETFFPSLGHQRICWYDSPTPNLYQMFQFQNEAYPVFVIGWVRNVAGTSSKITRIWFNLNVERAPGKQITWQFYLTVMAIH